MKKPKCILLDIEGTTSSISFVYDVMFPYVRKNLNKFLVENWGSDSVRDCLPLLADDLGHQNVKGWLGADEPSNREFVESAVVQLMDDDIKATGLKKLQGAIWKDGFESGQIVAHLFDDVAGEINTWTADGIEVRIYSSGSIQAQKLFFGHTVAGDILSKLSGHYDTTTGPKREASSYLAIATDIGLPPAEILFVSDVGPELDAAVEAGMEAILSIRPGNKPVENAGTYQSVSEFSAIKFTQSCV